MTAPTNKLDAGAMMQLTDEVMAREWLEKMGADLAPLTTLTAFCGFVRETDKYRLATKPTPERTGVGQYCQPGDRREPRWVVMYDDADRTTSVFEDEQDARDAFAASEGMGWNCWLFSPTPRAASPAAPAQSADMQVVFDSLYWHAKGHKRDEFREFAAGVIASTVAAPAQSCWTKEQIAAVREDAKRLHAKLTTRPLVSDAPAQSGEPFPYQKTFDAIAAATSVSAGRVAISVIKFREAFGVAAQPAQSGETVAWTADGLYDAIEEVLLHHRVSNMEGDDGEAYPLVDQLTAPGANSIESGKFEVRLICDAIYNEVLTVAAPQPAQTTESADTVTIPRELAENYLNVTGIPRFKRILEDALNAPQPAQTERALPLNFESRMTPYGMLVRALRIVAGTTLYDMAKHLSSTPATLSAVEFGRKPLTDAMVADTAAYFSSRGVHDTLHAISVAAQHASGADLDA